MIKSEISNTEQKEKIKKFPVLKQYISDDFVVLFSGPNKGTVVWVSEKMEEFAKNTVLGREIGEYVESFVDCDDDKHWKDFDGVLTLSNE